MERELSSFLRQNGFKVGRVIAPFGNSPLIVRVENAFEEFEIKVFGDAHRGSRECYILVGPVGFRVGNEHYAEHFSFLMRDDPRSMKQDATKVLEHMVDMTNEVSESPGIDDTNKFAAGGDLYFETVVWPLVERDSARVWGANGYRIKDMAEKFGYMSTIVENEFENFEIRIYPEARDTVRILVGSPGSRDSQNNFVEQLSQNPKFDAKKVLSIAVDLTNEISESPGLNKLANRLFEGGPRKHATTEVLMRRRRMTWAAEPPATPGYGQEDQGHPAHNQPDPNAEKYMNGDPDSWAETPNPSPYPEGNPPSIPGYDTEDQDHPAHKRNPRVPKEATRRMLQVKADKCVKIASHMLGRHASEEAVENQALDLMDLPSSQVDATLRRLSSDFLSYEEEEDGFEMMGGRYSEDEMEEDFEGEDYEGMLAQMEEEMEEEEVVARRRWANQNDPKGKTLSPDGEDEEEARKTAAEDEEEDDEDDDDDVVGSKKKKAAKKKKKEDDDDDDDDDKENFFEKMQKAKKKKKKAADEEEDDEEEDDEEEDDDDDEDEKEGSKKKAKLLSIFDKEDTHGDGFIMKEDWTGSRKLFASLDTDDDGIIARADISAGHYGCGRSAEEEILEEDIEEAMVEEMDDASMFSMDIDPMMGDPDSDEVLEEIFGGKRAAEDAEEEEEEEEVEEKEAKKKKASKTASRKPQPRKKNPGLVKLGSLGASNSELEELSKLWQSSPDVSDIFGI